MYFLPLSLQAMCKALSDKRALLFQTVGGGICGVMCEGEQGGALQTGTHEHCQRSKVGAVSLNPPDGPTASSYRHIRVVEQKLFN